MPGKQLYKTTNKVGTIMTYKKGTAELSEKTLNENIGTCAALSTMFLQGLIEGKAPASTNPDQTKCALIFAKAWIQNCDKATKLVSGDAGIEKFANAIVKAFDLKAGKKIVFKTHADAINHMMTNAGNFYFDLRAGHCVAAANVGNEKWYFFDSNGHGLWEYPAAKDFFFEATKHLKTAGWPNDSGAWVFPVTE